MTLKWKLTEAFAVGLIKNMETVINILLKLNPFALIVFLLTSFIALIIKSKPEYIDKMGFSEISDKQKKYMGDSIFGSVIYDFEESYICSYCGSKKSNNKNCPNCGGNK